MLKLKSLPKFSVLLVSLLTFGALAAGCGSNTSAPDTGQPTDRGRQIFLSKCGTCHMMAQAASSGTQGPDLDAAFSAAREVGMDDDTIKGIVRAQVQRPYPSNPVLPGMSMPADIVTGNDLEDVAAYVAKYAGVPGAEPPKVAGSGPGAELFANNGCGGCHTLAAADSSGTAGPDLDEFVPDLSKEEIHTAIVDPNKSKPKGFENAVMPSFAGKLSDKELDELVDFLMKSAGSGSS
ncbi:MAG: c-type cytochrome [Solirubrobacterales bacterium]|nr:c-type cytochrome [Solirubrobacterales bacterium]